MIKKFLLILKRIWFYNKRKRLSKIEEKLKKYNQEKSVEKMALKRDIVKHFKSQFFKKSKFIKPKIKNKVHIFMEINHKYANDMKRTKLKIDKNLTFK